MTSENGPVQLVSKRQRFLKRAKVAGALIPAKNQQPGLGYKAQQWGCGGSRSGPNGGRRKSGLTRRGRFNGQCGPGRFKAK